MKISGKKADYDKLHLSDIYSLMLFVLYKLKDIPEYSILSELCYLLDGNNLTRLLTYFAGRTVTFPTEAEFAKMANAMLMFQYINIEGDSFVAAQSRLNDLTKKQKDEVSELYLKILPIMKQYNIDRSQLDKNERRCK